MTGIQKCLSSAVLLLGCLASVTSYSQTYPSKAIRFVLQFSPGGGTDAIARPFSQAMVPEIGQQVLVDYKPGANGSIANQLVATAPADGYTLLFAAAGGITAAPHLHPGNVDPITAFSPVVLIASNGFAVVTHPSFPAKTFADLTEMARKAPGTITYGTSGHGGTPHLMGELYKSMGKLELVHVPYKGMGPALTAVLAGEVNFGFADIGTVTSHIKEGRLKALAVTSEERSPALPNVPTIGESGLPGYALGSWYGIFAPAGTPNEIVNKLNEASRRALAKPDLQERFAAQGMLLGNTTPSEFAAFVKKDFERLGEIIKNAGIRGN